MGLYGDTDPLAWTTTRAGEALGTGTPQQQIVANAVLGGLILISSSVSLGATLVLLPFVAAWFTLGLLRLIPTVDKYWPLN